MSITTIVMFAILLSGIVYLVLKYVGKLEDRLPKSVMLLLEVIIVVFMMYLAMVAADVLRFLRWWF